MALAGLLAAAAFSAAAVEVGPGALSEAQQLQSADPALFALFEAAGASAEDYHFARLASYRLKIGDMLLAKDQPDKARTLYQLVLDDTVFDDAAALRPVARARMGRLAAADGRPLDAIAIFTAALASIEDGEGPALEYRGEIQGDLAAALEAVGRHAEALEAVDQALALADERRGRDPLLQIRASALEGLGRWPEAEGLRSQLLARTPVRLLFDGPAAAKSPAFADAEVQLGRNLARQGKAAQAEVLLQDALGAYQPIYPATHPSVLTGQLELSRLWLEQLDKPADALAELRKAGRAVLAAGQQNTGGAKLARFRSLFRAQVAAAWAVAQPADRPAAPPALKPLAASAATARHGSPVVAAVFSGDGSQVISAAEEGSIIVWNASTGAPLATLSAQETGVVTGVQRDGDGVLFQSYDAVRFWTPGAPASEEILAPVSSMAMSPDRRWIVAAGNKMSGGPDGNVLWIYDRRTGTARTQVLETDDVAAIAVSPDGGRIALVEFDRPAAANDPDMIERLCLYSLPQGRSLACEGFDGGGGSLAFTPDGRHILNAGLLKPKLFDAATARLIKTFDIGFVDAGALSPDGGRMALIFGDGSVRVFDVETSRQIARLDGHAAAVTSVAFSPDGQRIVSGSEDQTVRIWNAATGAPLHTLGGQAQFARHTAEIRRAVFSPDGTKVASAAVDGLRVWDAATGVQLTVGRGGSSVEWSADGKRLLTPFGVTDAGSGEVLHPLDYMGLSLTPVYLGDGGVVTAFGLFDADGRKVKDLKLDGFARVVAAPAGSLFAVLGTGDDRVIDGRTGATVQPLPKLAYASFSFTGDGRRMMFGFGLSEIPVLGVFDATTGASVTLFDAKYSIWTEAVIDPAGRRAAAMSANRIYLWPEASAQRIQIAMPAKVAKAVFSPDGAVLAVALEDGTAQLRDAVSGSLRATLHDAPGALTDISFSRDGSRVMTVSTSRIMTVWNVASGDIVARLGQ